jgi:hypothetical protein
MVDTTGVKNKSDNSVAVLTGDFMTAPNYSRSLGVLSLICGQLSSAREMLPILAPALADVGAEIQVELLVNDAPDIRVGFELVAHGGTHRAEAAELRKLGIRVGLELLQVFSAHEIIGCAIMFDLELGISLLGLTIGEIGNWDRSPAAQGLCRQYRRRTWNRERLPARA